MSLTIGAIRPEMIKIIWPVVVGMIKLAIEESNEEISIDNIYHRLIDKDMILVTVAEDGEVIAAMTLERIVFNTGKTVLHLCTIGGDGYKKWWPLIDKVIDELAAEHDCEEIYIIGRPGWKRLLKDRGFNLVHTTLSRKVGV